MSTLRKQVLEEALKLPPTERSELIENLLTSFEFPSRKTIDDLWATEVESRINAFERGKISATPAKEVLKKIGKYKE